MLTKHDTGHAATVVTGWTESSDVQWLAAGTATGKVSECRYTVITGHFSDDCCSVDAVIPGALWVVGCGLWVVFCV